MGQQLQIFYIKRENRNPLILYDIPEKADLALIFRNNRVKGWFGTHPPQNDIQGIKNSLYKLSDKSVYTESDDRSFFIRLIICMLSFLTVFFLMSYLLRDPLPLVDEVLVGAAVAIVVYLLLVRQGRRSIKTEGKILQMRSHIDTIAFFEHEKLKEIELILESLSVKSNQDLYEIFMGKRKLLSPGAELGFLKNIEALLISEIKTVQKKSLDRVIKQWKREGDVKSDEINQIKSIYSDWDLYALWKILDQEIL